MMILIGLLIWSHCVLAQPLQADQHTALMSVYDSIGLSPCFHIDMNSFHFCFVCLLGVCVCVCVCVFFFFFFFFFFSKGCNTTVCPRFTLSSECDGSRLFCIAGRVTMLCVLESAFLCVDLDRVICRSFYQIQLNGSIPSTIGQLSALTVLYIVAVVLIV
jgi:hypothetical protein